jgi:RNA polymerase sigma-70 factor (ECF subfamily)
MRYTDDAVLVDAAQRAPAAFGALYERYHPLIFSYALRCTHDRMQAEDVAAETFLRALEALDHYQDRGIPFSAWLFRITINQIIQQSRHRRGITLQTLDSEKGCDAIYADEESQDDYLARQERAVWVRGELRRLPVDQQRVLWLRFWQDYSIRDVAARLGRSEAATKILLHRTIKRLRASPLMCA